MMMQLTPEAVKEALRDVIDPELGYNVVDLGLVYDISAESGKIHVVMTMTTPGCPASAYIQEGARQRLLAIDGASTASVDVVFSPPWGPDMMSDEAKRFFGFA